MKLETIGHATLCLYNYRNKPLLSTDPWICGSAYWRSWWLQNYPDASTINALGQSQYVYITHEHPDHFHPPSIRRLGHQPKYITADLPKNNMVSYLRKNEFQADVLVPYQWYNIGDGVKILSTPIWSDDSVLVIMTPTALIYNFNDSKPPRPLLKELRALREQHRHLNCIVASSHSPASIVSSFFRGAQRLELWSADDFVNHVQSLCKALDADLFLPFASNVTYLRSDTEWANAFRVGYKELAHRWNCRTKLLRPFSNLDLTTFEVTHLPTEEYNPPSSAAKSKITTRMDEESRSESFSSGDQAQLMKRITPFRYLFSLIYRNGIGFKLERREFTYIPKTDQFVEGIPINPSFVIEVPALALKESIAINHFGDLTIPMFMIVHLYGNLKTRTAYLFFMLVTVYEYGHVFNMRQLLSFGSRVLQSYIFQRDKIPSLAPNNSKK